MVAPFQPDPEQVAAIRAALPATGAGIFLDTATAGPLPVEGLKAMRELLAYEERVGRADVDSAEAFEERAGETRAVLATLLAADPDAFTLVPGTTTAIAWAAAAAPARAGQRVVTTDHEHPAVAAVLEGAAARAGLAVRQVALDADDTTLVARFAAAVDEATCLLVVSHVTWDTGRVLPVADLVALARRSSGAVTVIDGAQAVGAIATDVPAIGPDVYAVSGYKWLLGPHGVGAVWRSARATALGPLPASALHRPSVVGLGRSVGWLEMYVGLPWALARAATLTATVRQALGAIEGVELLTGGGLSSPLVAFRIRGWPAETARAALARRVFAVCAALPHQDAIRISVGWFNTASELARFAGAVAELAAATPATLPERPRLVVLPAEPGGPS
ncbi:MAG TPA: aminotransferase class V-fold PLP-dependent enzyme [Candidatus Sulfotelmatobacter sp.]|nr:aminotransferase class V-fold PLP-dependent enzyme [Candidatus Sulfotelmatobacter sp.]